MIIKATDKLYGPDGNLFVFTGGLKRSDFDGEDINKLRMGGYDMCLYQQPEGYDPAINKLDGVIVPTSDTPYCSEGFVALTGPEIESNLISTNLSIENQRKHRFREEVDDHYLRQVEAELTGGTPDYASCMAMKAQIRLDLPYKDG